MQIINFYCENAFNCKNVVKIRVVSEKFVINREGISELIHLVKECDSSSKGIWLDISFYWLFEYYFTSVINDSRMIKLLDQRFLIIVGIMRERL